MKEEQMMKINEEEKVVDGTGVEEGKEKVLSIPGFMNKRQEEQSKNSGPKRLKYIKVANDRQTDWELLRQLDGLVGLVLAGKEPKSGEIRYHFTSKDSYRSERIKGVIRVNK